MFACECWYKHVPCCQVGDFGLARVMSGNEPVATASMGTVTHMPPEALVEGTLTKVRPRQGPDAPLLLGGLLQRCGEAGSELVDGGCAHQLRAR